MREGSKVSHDYLVALGRRLVADAARDLEFLTTIDRTCGALHFQADAIRRVTASIVQVREKVDAYDGATPLDPSGDIATNLERAQSFMADAFRDQERKRNEVQHHPAISPVDGVVEAFNDVLSAMRDNFESIGELLASLVEADADCSAQIGKPSSVDDLLALLHRQ